MINIDIEHLVSFNAAAKFVASRFQDAEDSRPIHVSTLYRWSSKGVRGVRLEAVGIGGKRVTSKEALQRFFDRLAGQDDQSPPRSRQASPAAHLPTAPSDRRARARRVAAAEKELEKLGI